MNNEINYDELEKLPYFNLDKKDDMAGRFVLFALFKDGDTWKMPLNMNGEIILLEATPVKSLYISEEIINVGTDIFVPFIDFLYSHASWIDLNYFLNSLTNDIHNLYTSIEKIDIFQKIKVDRTNLSELVSTEIEYILITCKSLFDLLQKIISIIWNKHIKLFEGKKSNLPERFRKMVYFKNRRLELDEIIKRKTIPEKLAQYYYNIGKFYEKLKLLRDDIVHHGFEIANIYVFDEGFAIKNNSNLYKYYDIWDEDDKKPNDLYSLRPLLNYWINNSINACNDFVNVIGKIIKFPPSLIPKHNVYIRTPHLKQYNNMVKELKEYVWWKI